MKSGPSSRAVHNLYHMSLNALETTSFGSELHSAADRCRFLTVCCLLPPNTWS